jgi:chromate transporter
MSIKSHIPFLKNVFIHSITAFGGPQGHIGMLHKTFVEKTKDVTEKELQELNAFCNLMPGPSSTQTITLIGYKKGGVVLAFITLLIWILPACFLMGLLSFFIDYLKDTKYPLSVFKYVQPMALGFLLYSAIRLFKISINNVITKYIFIVITIGTCFFFKTPWLFPVAIILSGLVTNLSKKRFPSIQFVHQKINWNNLYVFIILFIFLGYLSETATQKNWQHRKLYNLTENNYRFSSLVFGGGDVLMPMMYDQYVTRPTNKIIQANKRDVLKMEKEDFLIGYGMVRAIPGPVFSIGSFTGGMLLRNENNFKVQVLGCFLGSISIFLPSILLILFFYPVWNNLKKYAIIYRSLEGINAAIVGLMFGAFIYLVKDFAWADIISLKSSGFMFLIVAISTFLVLYKTKLPAPFVVLICLILGYIF